MVKNIYINWLRWSHLTITGLVILMPLLFIGVSFLEGFWNLKLLGLALALWILWSFWNFRLKGIKADSKANLDNLLNYFSYQGRTLFWQAHLLGGSQGLTPLSLLRALITHKGVKLTLLRLGLTTEEVGEVLLHYPHDLNNILSKSLEFATSEHSHISWDDLWRGLIAASNGMQELLAAKKITESEAIAVVDWTKRQLYYKSPRFSNGFFSDLFTPNRNLNRTWTARPTPTLDHFSKNLTDFAKIGLMTSAKVREPEVEESVRILSKSQENNLILVGENGVGKTSIVGDIALRLIRGDLPALRDYKLIALDVPAMIGLGGDLQATFSRAVNEAAASGNVILFIGDLDQFAKTKSDSGFDLSAILVSTLQNQNLQLIGTADALNYKKYVETNANLAPLFTRLNVEEMSPESSILVLEDISQDIESKLGVTITLDAIKTAVDLSTKYIHSTKLPEKAKQLLDEAAAAVSRAHTGLVTGAEVRGVMAGKTNVPVGELSSDEKTKLLNLEESMRGRIIGQSEAVKSVVQALIRSRVGVSANTKKPIGSFLFLGPTGVGKTELAKTLAWAYFGDDTKMIRLDMSEYQTRESVHNLIGAPAVSGDLALAGGSFTEAVKATPFSVILLDEIEKAHPDVLNLFLQVLDEGHLTDNLGNTVDFSHTIIIATSNAQSPYIQTMVESNTNYEEMVKNILPKLTQENFKPELINRFDGVIVFRPLNQSEIEEIANLKVTKLIKSLKASKDLTLTVTPEAVKKLAELGFDPAFGARPLERTIREKLENLIANRLLTSDNLKEITVNLSDL